MAYRISHPILSRRATLAGLATTSAAALLAPRRLRAAPETQAAGHIPESLVAAAQKEGKLVYWGPEEVPLVRALIGRFNATYPGIEVTHFRIEPAPAVQRMLAEQQAGQVNVDAFDFPLLYSTPILDHGLAEQDDWAGQYGTEADYIFHDGRAVACWDLEVPICVNTDLVKPGEITSWDDLLAPKWRGKVLLEARGLGLAILMAKWGEAETVAWIGRLRDNRPVVMVGGSPTAEALSSGRVALAVGTYSSKIDLMRRAGAPVDWLTVGPIPSMMYAMAVAKGCAHPNAARLWTAWIASPQGSKDLFETTNFGLVHGNNISPNGRKMREAGAEIVLESTDPVVSQRRLTAAAAAIGALK
jgi:ABC-type Fe3+ transport system substrate-binding protein